MILVIVPHFLQALPTLLDWHNCSMKICQPDFIHFQEEFNKQAHVTNGIITQKIEVGLPVPMIRSSQEPAIKENQRFIISPFTTITPYNYQEDILV